MILIQECVGRNFYTPCSEMVSVVNSSQKICYKASSFLSELFSHEVVSINFKECGELYAFISSRVVLV